MLNKLKNIWERIRGRQPVKSNINFAKLLTYATDHEILSTDLADNIEIRPNLVYSLEGKILGDNLNELD